MSVKNISKLISPSIYMTSLFYENQPCVMMTHPKAHRWKAYLIAYNPAIQEFALKCNPDLLRFFFFDKAGKNYFVHNFSGVHFRSLPLIQLFVGFDPLYRSLATLTPYAIHPL